MDRLATASFRLEATNRPTDWSLFATIRLGEGRFRYPRKLYVVYDLRIVLVDCWVNLIPSNSVLQDNDRAFDVEVEHTYEFTYSREDALQSGRKDETSDGAQVGLNLSGGSKGLDLGVAANSTFGTKSEAAHQATATEKIQATHRVSIITTNGPGSCPSWRFRLPTGQSHLEGTILKDRRLGLISVLNPSKPAEIVAKLEIPSHGI